MSNEILLVPHKLPDDWQVWCLLADLHCGSPNGLNPQPESELQEKLLRRYEDAILWFGPPPDVVVAVGDVTEGIDPRWLAELGAPGGETSYPKQFVQSAEILSMWKAKREYILVSGTQAHSGVSHQSFEPAVATALQAVIYQQSGDMPQVSVRRKLKTTINDWFFLEARHFINRSVIFHGRNTAPARSQMWNILNSALSAYEKGRPIRWPDLLVFGHTHYYTYQENPWVATKILPSWKASGDKYGDELMDGHIDLGVFKLVVGPTKEESWGKSVRIYQASLVDRVESR